MTPLSVTPVIDDYLLAKRQSYQLKSLEKTGLLIKYVNTFAAIAV